MSSVHSPSSDVRNRIIAALGRWRGGLPDEQRPLFERFVGHAIDRLRGPYLALHHPTQVLRHLELAFNFARVRSPEQVKVDVRAGESKGVIAMSAMPIRISCSLARDIMSFWAADPATIKVAFLKFLT